MAFLKRTDFTSWSVSDLEAAVAAVKLANPQASALRIPRYQRNIVWNEAQQRSLIESIFAGYPIGSLLLWQEQSRNDFQLVDGLQRTSTLIAYQEKPLSLSPVPEAVTDLLVNTIQHESTSEVDRNALESEIEAWMRRTEALKATRGFTPSGFLDAITSYLELTGDAPMWTKDLAAETIDIFRDEVSIDSVQVPVVIYTGPESELPNIFELVNTKGTKLSKYQVFAASWINSDTLVANEAVIQAVDRKYQSLQDAGFEIDGLPDDHGPITDHNLYEYLFGLGKVLVDRYPLLFDGRSDDPADIEPIAFSLATIALGRPLAQMKELPTLMPRMADGRINPGNFETAITNAADFVDKALAKHLRLRLNSTTTRPFIGHSESQILSMVARVAVGMYENIGSTGTLQQREEWSAESSEAELAIPVAYLTDVLHQVWKGGVDARFYAHVWAAEQEPGHRDDRYVRIPGRGDIREELDRWFEAQLERRQRRRKNVRASEKVFLKFLYSTLVSVADDEATEFEIEHLFPVARITEAIADDEDGWPISCISNLAVIPKVINRSSSSQTLTEYLISLEDDDPTRAESERATLEPWMLCEWSDLAVSDEASEASALTFDRYVGFLRTRWETIREQVLSNLGY